MARSLGTMSVVLTSLLVCIYFGGLSPATAAAQPANQWILECQDSNPRLERLALAIERGHIEYVRGTLDNGADVREMWRDLPPQVCRSLLLRSIWYGQEEIFRLLLKRGADPLSIPREALGIPVRTGRVEIVRTLFALGLKPHDDNEIVQEALQSRNLAMLELLSSSGISINASNVPAYSLTNDITRFLVPKYLGPNDSIGLGLEPCALEEIFDLLSPEQDGCEGTIGPLWLHFVVTGNHEIVEFMIKHGADLTFGAKVWDGGDFRPFTAMDVAAKRKDKRMMDLLRRSGPRAR
jgi:hypothetical protein